MTTVEAVRWASPFGMRRDRLATSVVVAMMLLLALAVGGQRLAAGGARLSSPAGGFSTPLAVGAPASITLPLDVRGGDVTIESVRLAQPVPGLELTFQVAQGPCPQGLGLTELPAECDLRPADGATVTPGETRLLVVTYALTQPGSAKADDLVIDYRDGWHHRTTHSRGLMCFNLTLDGGLCR